MTEHVSLSIETLIARLDVALAELDAAIEALDLLERIIDRKGFLKPEHQHALQQAKALLIEHNRRKAEHVQVWEDRK
jgi:hypothetical protein